MMYDPDHHKMIEALIERVGNKEECLRLGFIGRDDNQTFFVTAVGMGYLLDVGAREIGTIAEAYAAGYQQGEAAAKDAA